MRPVLRKRAFVPAGLLNPKQVRGARKSLRFSEVSSDRVSHILKGGEVEHEQEEEDFDYDDYEYTVVGEEVTVNEFRVVRGGYSLPRAYAADKFPNLRWRDTTTFPHIDMKTRGKKITPRDDQQAVFFKSLLDAANMPGPQNILANATTGAGKSVAGIYLGWMLQTPTLIVVDSNSIAAGWLKNFRKLFGQGWTERNVGRAQQNKCDFKGKAFVIAMAQSLARRKYPREFYDYFGLVMVDEIQVFGGPHFSPILYMFPARVRLGLTAENRSGAFGRLIKTHLGETRVISQQKVMEPLAWVLYNRMQKTWRCQNDGALISGLSYDTARNQRIANLIKIRGYDRGRQVLVLGDRTAQLLQLRDMCVELGIPSDIMGIHAGTYQTDRFVIYYKLPGSEKRNRLHVAENYNRARTITQHLWNGNYTDVTLPAALYNRLQAGGRVQFEYAREQFSPSQYELDNIKHSCQIIFATYKIFAKGIDVPRLDMGVEALPSGNVKQPLGRVLRLMDGKPIPEWYSIHDVIELPEEDRFKSQQGIANVLNTFFEGKTKIRIAALKRAHAKIKVQKDG